MLTALKSRPAKLIHIMPSLDRSGVCAVTSLGNDVFVARYDSQEIEVYDAMTFELPRHITVPGLGKWPIGIAVCASNQCVYLSDYEKNSIHRVYIEQSGRRAAKKWSVDSRPAGLSVNIAHNVVVTCSRANKLQEYTMHGALVREISPSGYWGGLINTSWHAIQLSTGDYVVSQNTPTGTFRIIGGVEIDGENGKVKHTYQPSERSGVGEMNGPSSLAVTSNEDILVADSKNNRILSINRSSGCLQELALSVDGGIREPRGLCLDESRSRLYVGELAGEHRVLVFDIVAVTLP